MKVIIFGSTGMLGSDLVSHLKDGGSGGAVNNNSENIEVIGSNSKELDISDQSKTSSFIINHNPDIIINCAAYTNVDGCESNRERAFNINAVGVKNIVMAAKQANAKVAHVSTDYVFNGLDDKDYSEEAQTNPLSVYGNSKLEGEQCLRESIDNHVIIRTAWLYGPNGQKQYVSTMLRLAGEKSELKIVDDQIGSPTYTPDLAKAIWLLAVGKHRGIFNVTNAGACSRYEWSKKIFEIAGLNIDVKPISSNEFKRPAPVPMRSVLNCEKFRLATGFQMRDWDEALKDYLKLLGRAV